MLWGIHLHTDTNVGSQWAASTVSFAYAHLMFPHSSFCHGALTHTQTEMSCQALSVLLLHTASSDAATPVVGYLSAIRHRVASTVSSAVGHLFLQQHLSFNTFLCTDKAVKLRNAPTWHPQSKGFLVTHALQCNFCCKELEVSSAT